MAIFASHCSGGASTPCPPPAEFYDCVQNGTQRYAPNAHHACGVGPLTVFSQCANQSAKHERARLHEMVLGPHFLQNSAVGPATTTPASAATLVQRTRELMGYGALVAGNVGNFGVDLSRQLEIALKTCAR